MTGMRRGLPRVAGGEPWPDAAESVVAQTDRAATTAAAPALVPDAVPAAPSADPVPAAAAAGPQLRRGLPRVTGGDPWPGTGALAAPAAAAPVAAENVAPVVAAAAPVTPGVSAQGAEPAISIPPAAVAATQAAPASPTGVSVALRRGLPRVAGGDNWPTAGSSAVAAPATVQSAATPAAASAAVSATPVTPAPPIATAPAAQATQAPAAVPAAHSASQQAARSAVRDPEPRQHAAAPATSGPAAAPPASSEVRKRRGARFFALITLGAIAAAGMVVLAARGITTLPGVPEFLERYPGHTELPEFVDEGFPAWARWSHYLNFLFMVLIIRSGLLVRTQQKPPAFFTPNRGGKKVSIFLWAHVSLDLLWILNGLFFIVLLFATGHWARIVPTTWEAAPNALSAALQYLTLEWPIEDGWVNYNSLQQLMYFAVVFIAAPLAIASGLRMSSWWPAGTGKFSVVSGRVARAVHFPTMLFFVMFVIVHVVLVFATGALKNLGHMYAGTPVAGWVGFWWFAGGLLLAIGAVIAMRPLVLAPLAQPFGKVTQR